VSASRHAVMRTRGTASTVALACATLAACGSTPAGTIPGTAGGSGVCAAPGRAASLTVERVSAFPRNHLRFAFPPLVTVSDPGQLRTVARAACALPPMPSGAMSCPADLGISYRLSFTATGRRFPVVRIQAGGCGEVRGLGRTRWTARSPGFWRTLGTALGISHPDAAAFTGTTG
jgi:hypothetical protein